MNQSAFSSLGIIIAFLGFSQATFSQTSSQQALWYGYFFTIPIDSNWYTVTEIQERHQVDPFSQNQFLIRSRLHRSLGESWDSSTGMSLFLHHRIASLDNEVFEWPELRPHLDATYKTKFLKIPIEQRIRTEARFYKNLDLETGLPDEGYFFRAFRYRYRIQATITLAEFSNGKSLKLKLADEIMGMSAGEVGELRFDQNRISGDLNFYLSQDLILEVGYLYWHQKRESGNFLDQHILRTVLRHRLDFSKK